MPRLSALERERAVYLTCFGTTNNNIAIKFGCTKQTVIKLFEQVNQIKHTVNCPRSEMQRSTMPQTDQYLRCCFYVIGTEWWRHRHWQHHITVSEVSGHLT